MKEPIEVILDLAYQRYRETNDERRNLTLSCSFILTADVVLIGLLINSLIDVVSLLALFSLTLLIDSLVFCLYPMVAQRFKGINVTDIWQEISSDVTVDSWEMVAAKVAAGLNKIGEVNTGRTQRLWQYYNGSIGALVSSVFLLLLATL